MTAPGRVAGGLEGATRSFVAGRPVVLVDDRGGGGSLVVAADRIDRRAMAFVVRHTSGFVCVALTGDDCDRLALPPMVRDHGHPGPAFTVTVDAADGITTGISAADRAHTARLLAAPATVPDALTRPGHVAGVRAADGGVLTEPGPAEGAVDLARLAGCRPAGVLAQIVRADGRTADAADLAAFGAVHGLDVVTTAELVEHRRRSETLVEAAARCRMPTRHGDFTAVGYRSHPDGGEHLALVAGDVAGRSDVLVHLHDECLCGDVLGSRDCPCRSELEEALAAVAGHGCGVVLYRRPPGGLFGHPPDVGGPAPGRALLDAVLTDLGVRTWRPVIPATRAAGAAS